MKMIIPALAVAFGALALTAPADAATRKTVVMEKPVSHHVMRHRCHTEKRIVRVHGRKIVRWVKVCK